MTLNNNQCDALRELGNIGAAHAATTLSTMLMTNIEMTVPEIDIIQLSHLHECVGDEMGALVLFEINGEVTSGGYILLNVPKQSIIRLTNVMLGMTDFDRDLSEMDESAIIEIGNIMVSAFLDGVAGLLNIIMLPSPPNLTIDMPHAAFECILSAEEDIDEVVIFKTELKSDQYEIVSDIFLLPNNPMLTDIINRLGDLLKPI